MTQGLLTVYIPDTAHEDDVALVARLWAALNGLGAHQSPARDLFRSDASVCLSCYWAHHYGAHEHDGKWYAGEDDEPCDREPLALLDGLNLADNTDSETGSGIDEFSWRTCEGCGSTLGGSRYLLAVWEV